MSPSCPHSVLASGSGTPPLWHNPPPSMSRHPHIHNLEVRGVSQILPQEPGLDWRNSTRLTATGKPGGTVTADSLALSLAKPGFPFLFQALGIGAHRRTSVSSLLVASQLCPLPPGPGRLCQRLVIYILEQLLTDSCELGGV